MFVYLVHVVRNEILVATLVIVSFFYIDHFFILQKVVKKINEREIRYQVTTATVF